MVAFIGAGAYKASLKQAFGRTVKEARFGMVFVDAPNLSADDLKAYWSQGQVPLAFFAQCMLSFLKLLTPKCS